MSHDTTPAFAIGDRIRLNDTAAHWTRGKIFKVTEVRSWGLVCEWNSGEGIAPYRAQWAEIAGRVPFE